MMPKELKEKNISELNQMAKQAKEDLFSLQIKRATGQLEKAHSISAAKVRLARILTAAKEKSLNR